MGEPLILSTARTAIGTFGGAFKETPVVSMGSHVIREVMTRAGLRPKPSPEILDIAPHSLKGRDLTDLSREGTDRTRRDRRRSMRVFQRKPMPSPSIRSVHPG